MTLQSIKSIDLKPVVSSFVVGAVAGTLTLSLKTSPVVAIASSVISAYFTNSDSSQELKKRTFHFFPKDALVIAVGTVAFGVLGLKIVAISVVSSLLATLPFLIKSGIDKVKHRLQSEFCVELQGKVQTYQQVVGEIESLAKEIKTRKAHPEAISSCSDIQLLEQKHFAKVVLLTILRNFEKESYTQFRNVGVGDVQKQWIETQVKLAIFDVAAEQDRFPKKFHQSGRAMISQPQLVSHLSQENQASFVGIKDQLHKIIDPLYSKVMTTFQELKAQKL